jgi:hypothetical protein
MMAAKKTDGVIANPRGITQGTPIISQVASSEIVTEAVNGAQRKVQYVRTVLFFEGDKVNTDDLSNWDLHVERGFVTEG